MRTTNGTAAPQQPPKQGRQRRASGALIRCGGLIGLLVVLLVLAGCGVGDAPGVAFVEPADGATVHNPVHVRMQADHFTVEPAGPVKAGHGHLHLMVDTDCVAAGRPIPKDAQHLHYGKGQTTATLQLTPGVHQLCLQAGDGNHMALAEPGLQQRITITVK